MKKITFALLIIATLFGCKKPSNRPLPRPNPSSIPKISTTRTLNPNGHYILQTYSYLDNGQLKKQVSRDETNGLSIIQEYFYRNGIAEYSIISSDTRKISRINYFHANQHLIKMDYLEYDPSGAPSLTFSRTLEYSGNLLSKITTLSDQGNPQYYETLTFVGDNVTAIGTYSIDGTAQDLTEYLYDMEINPFQGILEENQQAWGLSKNNPIRVRYTSYTNPTTSSERRYEYRYNSEKQPVTKSFLGPSGRELQITFTYK